MKKAWQTPTLEVLNISMTALGPNNGAPDQWLTDPFDGETVHTHS